MNLLASPRLRQTCIDSLAHFTWFAMLYAAGQGIGIIFWSIFESTSREKGELILDVCGTGIVEALRKEYTSGPVQ